MCVQVDHDAAPLHARFGHVLDAQLDCVGSGLMLARPRVARVGAVGRPHDVLAGPIAVVVDRFRYAVAVGVEHRTHVREAVPLRRILQVHDHEVIADHVTLRLVIGEEPVVHVGPAVAQRRADHRRMAARVKHIAPGEVERQAQAERTALANLGNALAHLFRRQQIDLSPLVVGAEIAPVGSWRAPDPPLVRIHQRAST